MYEIIDHTADIGIRVEGQTLSDLFTEAARAFFDLMFSSKREFIPSIEVPVSIEAPAVDQLLVRWLQELLFIHETRRLVLSNFWVDEISETKLFGTVKGLKFDSTRHTQKLSVKAVTYHHLKVERAANKIWQAEIIFDI